MRLVKFRVTNFRSVEDSGWIDANNVTALIGTNESGKTNLIVPLWKLNPAKDGEINLLADAPRKRYNEIKNMKVKPIFITAFFELPDKLIQQIVMLTDAPADMVRIAEVTRNLEGGYTVGFPEYQGLSTVDKEEVNEIIVKAHNEITTMSVAAKAEEPIRTSILKQLTTIIEYIDSIESVDEGALTHIQNELNLVNKEGVAKRSSIVPRFEQACDSINEMLSIITTPSPSANAQARKIVRDNLPSFVYYSNYGNLDSEIYLPHVIENMNRDDLGSREEAKVRTLKVLFEFVKLSPEEILELGRDFPKEQGRPTEAQIKVIAEKKKEREILLQSASSNLTSRFRDWWKQGDYRLRFQADGSHFRIWVSDDKRLEEIELEGRSTGLQWFLSFYLIFLVESKDSHQDSILLLDEPGLSLHPLSQKDLSLFFESLSTSNQILYTTHSPFMVDPNHLDRVRSVYVNENGTTVASSNLRAGETQPAQSKSIYAVHAALGLAVSDAIFQGCQSIIVEGLSDQLYLNAIKNYLIRQGKINPKREMVFVPSGGVRGISATSSILTAKEESLPYVILDSDRSGIDTANKLKSSTYQGAYDRIIMIGDMWPIPNAEVEDILPPSFFAGIITKYLRGPEDDFSDVLTSGAIIPQIEAYAKSNELTLVEGWKVELARQTKARILRSNSDSLRDAAEHLNMWIELFNKLDS